MRVLVIAASRRGCTREIAEAIAAALERLKPEGDPADVEGLIDATGAVAHRVLAGRLDRKLLGFGDKAVAVAVRAPEGDFRDCDAIDGFAGEIAATLAHV